MECKTKNTTKREEVVTSSKKESLYIRRRNLKGREIYHGLELIFAGVHKMERAREGVAVLLNDVWHGAVIDFGLN